MNRIVVKVRDLQRGDFLIGSRRTVEYVTAGARTPARKREVKLEGESGVRVWGADTTIAIQREA
jgi:hypothetical protein